MTFRYKDGDDEEILYLAGGVGANTDVKVPTVVVWVVATSKATEKDPQERRASDIV
jgi:hypothetical protein